MNAALKAERAAAEEKASADIAAAVIGDFGCDLTVRCYLTPNNYKDKPCMHMPHQTRNLPAAAQVPSF